MAMPSKQLIHNQTLTTLLERYLVGVPLAQLHREYTAQGEDYGLSLPVFMRLIKREIQKHDTENR